MRNWWHNWWMSSVRVHSLLELEQYFKFYVTSSLLSHCTNIGYPEQQYRQSHLPYTQRDGVRRVWLVLWRRVLMMGVWRWGRLLGRRRRRRDWKVPAAGHGMRVSVHTHTHTHTVWMPYFQAPPQLFVHVVWLKSWEEEPEISPFVCSHCVYTGQMIHHRGASLSKKQTAGFIICRG